MRRLSFLFEKGTANERRWMVSLYGTYVNLIIPDVDNQYGAWLIRLGLVMRAELDDRSYSNICKVH